MLMSTAVLVITVFKVQRVQVIAAERSHEINQMHLAES